MSSESSPTSLLYPYVAGGDNGEGQEEEEEDIIFCSKENMNEAAIYINQELELLGIGNIMVDGGGTPDIVNMMNSTYQLLDMYRNTLKRLDDLGTNLQKTRSNLTLHSETISRLKAELEGSERRVKEHQEKERQVGLRNKSLTVQLKVKEEECRKIKLNMSHKEQQYLHDMKKREREYYRINERLGQFVLDKSHERKLGIKMLNNLQKSNLSSDVVKKEETMYQLVINHYEERQKELMLENTSLRESLSNIERELVAMLNQQDHSFTSNDKENSPPDTSVSSADHKDDRLLSSAHYQMPFDISRPNIERSLQDKCKSLKEHIKTLKGGRGGGGRGGDDKKEGYEREIEELEKKLGDYKYIINQHEAMIEQQLQEGKTEAALVHLNESHYLKRMELLEMKEEKVRHREEQIRDEEIRLNMLAKILDRERKDFEDKKSGFLRQQLDNSIFATSTAPTADNNISHMESFFAGLMSTPYVNATSTTCRGKSTIVQRGAGGYHDGFDTTPLKLMMSPPPSIDLKQDISLTSDDGIESNTLNDLLTN